MAQQIGRLLLIKHGNAASPEVFTSMCGFRARSFSMSSNEVDTTVPDCDDPGGVVQKTSVPGISDRTFAGTGLFDNDDTGKAVADAARLATVSNYQVIVPGYGTFQGPYIITDFQWSGEMEGNMEFQATFKPSGALTFTATP
jgi:TP901-1 family phage major tail protein